MQIYELFDIKKLFDKLFDALPPNVNW